MFDRFVCFKGSQLVTARSVSSVVSARSAVVVRDRFVRRGAHSGRRQRFHRPTVSASFERPLHGRRVGQPSAPSLLQLFTDRFRSDAVLAARVRPANDGCPLLGHQFHGGRSHVLAQVNTTARSVSRARFVCTPLTVFVRLKEQSVQQHQQNLVAQRRIPGRL